MARKKEPERVGINREKIANAVQKQMRKGSIEQLSADDIAKAVGMSKSTMYVYFESKEQIYDYIACKSMEMFYKEIVQSLAAARDDKHEVFIRICHVMTQLRENQPLCFERMIQHMPAKGDHSAGRKSGGTVSVCKLCGLTAEVPTAARPLSQRT